MKHSSRRGILYMIVSVFFFASMGACLKYALQEIPVYEAIFFRAIVSSLIIGLVLLRKRIPYMGKNRKALLFRSLCGFLAMSCVFYALAHIPFADATVLHQTSPLFVALFSVLFLGERVSRLVLFYSALALCGAILVLQPQWNIVNAYGLIAILGAAFAGLAYVSVRHLHQTDSSWVIAFHFASTSSLLSLPLMTLDFVTPSLSQWVALLGAGLFGTGGQIFMTVSYRYEEAARLAPFSNISVALAFIYGLMFWSETPDLYKIIGMILIIIAGMAIAKLNLSGKRVVALGDD